MDGILKSRAMPAPFDQMKALEPIAEILERADLVVVQGTWFERRQAEFSDALCGIARREDVRRMRVNPGHTSGEGGQVVVDGRRRQPLGDKGLLPGGDLAAETCRDSVVAVAIPKEALEAIKV